VPDPSVGQPHARLLIAAGRLGLEDLGTPAAPSSTARGSCPSTVRATSAPRSIRSAAVELALSRPDP
jgi:hypothetical protein